MPKGDAESKFVQIGELETKLGEATNELKGMINAAVEKIMSDMPTFVKFVESGKYSGERSYSLPNQTVGLDIALKTYIVSSAMLGNKWWASPRIGHFEREDFDGCLDENNVCCESCDQGGELENNMATYWSPDTKRSYGLHRSGDGPTPYEMTQALVNNQWAPLNILFDGAFNCTAEGNAGTNNINFNFDGSLNVACISQLPMFAGCKVYNSKCPAPLLNGTCPFDNPDLERIVGCDMPE